MLDVIVEVGVLFLMARTVHIAFYYLLLDLFFLEILDLLFLKADTSLALDNFPDLA